MIEGAEAGSKMRLFEGCLDWNDVKQRVMTSFKYTQRARRVNVHDFRDFGMISLIFLRYRRAWKSWRMC